MKKNILIVDDDKRLRELLKDYLTEKNLEIYLSEDYDEAKDILSIAILISAAPSTSTSTSTSTSASLDIDLNSTSTSLSISLPHPYPSPGDTRGVGVRGWVCRVGPGGSLGPPHPPAATSRRGQKSAKIRSKSESFFQYILLYKV